MIKVGDKVSFLNETGNGIVKKIISNNLVSVEIDNGFEINYPINQLVNLSVPTSEKKSTENDFENNTTELELSNSDEIFLNNEDEDAIEENKKYNGVGLVFEAEDERQLLKSPIVLSVYNGTAYTVFLTFNKNINGNFKGIECYEILPGECVLLERIKRTDFEKHLTEMTFQLLFFRKGIYDYIAPVTKTIKTNPVKLFKESSFVKYEFTRNRACLHSIYEIKHEDDTISFYDEKLDLKNHTSSKNKISKPNKLPQVMEIDLHIEELMDNISGMSNGDMIVYQLNHFTKVLDQAIVDKVSKLIVIHGVGNGKLKAEVRKIVDEMDCCSYHDASFQKYGWGATEIIIK